MMAESGGDPWATDYDYDGTVDRGCWQVNSIHAALVHGDLQSLYDPVTNAKVAAEILATNKSWCPWTTAKKLHLCK